MPNMSPTRNEMPVQAPDVRNKNFSEVALGYTEEQAIDEAKRCLGCKNKPCSTGCPVQIDIPAFIAQVAEGNFAEAYKIITKSSSLPAVCGRVCPQETQCESKCVRGKKGEPVAIGRLERFVADWHNAQPEAPVEKPAPNGHKAAVIGSGPSGLACAGDLAKKGYDVTIFEALHVAGGVLSYGIPEFRLPKSIVQKEIGGLKALGVKVETNTVVGKTISVDELMKEEGFESIFIGSGVPGTNAVDVAQGLLSSAGGRLSELCTRPPKELMEHKGIGEARAVTIAAALELGRRFLTEASAEQITVTGPVDVFRLMLHLCSNDPGLTLSYQDPVEETVFSAK